MSFFVKRAQFERKVFFFSGLIDQIQQSESEDSRDEGRASYFPRPSKTQWTQPTKVKVVGTFHVHSATQPTKVAGKLRRAVHLESLQILMSGRHHLRRTGSPSYFFLDAAIGRGEQAAVRHRSGQTGRVERRHSLARL